MAMLAAVAALMARGGGFLGTAAYVDRVEASLVSQAGLIRNKVVECWTLTLGSPAADWPRTSAPIAPAQIPGATSCLHPSSNACYRVDLLACPGALAENPAGSGIYTSEILWRGTRAALLPPPPEGFTPWVYARDGGNIRVSTRPMNVASQDAQDAIMRARRRFSGPATANGLTEPHHETDRDETTWIFTVWIRR